MHDDILVKDWPGLDAATIETLKKRYFSTLKTFHRATEHEEGREALREEGLTDARIDALRDDARRHLDALPEVVIHGVLEDFFETGTEGVCWSVYEDGKQGYDGLHVLGGGEHLRVTDETGAVRFEGFIEPDTKKGWVAYASNAPDENYGQPTALGMWIHWTQSGWEPDDWAALFFRPHMRDHRKGPPLRAVLTYNKKRN